MSMILTPVTLWKDFDITLPLCEEVIAEYTDGNAVYRELYFKGRQTKNGRVKIYAKYAFPCGAEEFPAVMILFEAGFPFDETYVKRYLTAGYGVFCVDYCGENGTDRHTVYPEDVDYANYVRAGTHLEFADPTAKETSWYEWAGVARYAARYLSERKEVSCFGAVGLRTGGEILFKVAPYAPMSCMISVCAAGWLAYRGTDKFADKQLVFNEERHRFIAGIDSQSYAPYVKCPVLLISAVNDEKYDFDRVYDTFRQINPQVEKALLFSAHGNGLVGTHSQENMNLFLDKYLKGRSVFVSKPINLSVEEDGEGNLTVKGQFDPNGEIKEYGIFYTEKITDSKARDWTRILGKAEDLSDDNVGTIPLNVYMGSNKALVFTFVNYSNNFSITSKILEVPLEKQYSNSRPVSRVVYTSEDGRNGFVGYRRRAGSIADCFMDGSSSQVKLLPGYGGIPGITCTNGIISYRVSEPRYEPPEGASLEFDAYCAEDATLSVTFFSDNAETVGYTAEARIEGGEKWKKILLNPDDFKTENGAHLSDFKGMISMMIFSSAEVLVNNVIWI